MISVLIPTYNHVCVSLVREVVRQCQQCEALEWEVVVADDGSTDKDSVEDNQAITTFPRCRYIVCTENRGRAAIRNFLAQQARGQWLLYIDSDLGLRNNKDYISSYVDFLRGKPSALVCCGGYRVVRPPRPCLRYFYERHAEKAQRADFRRRHPYASFKLSNTIVARSLMLAHPLDADIKRYGYEDVILGRVFRDSRVPVFHIDNPVDFWSYESDEAFMAKEAEAMENLWLHRDELKDDSRLLALACFFRRIGVRGVAFRHLARHLRHSLVHSDQQDTLSSQHSRQDSLPSQRSRQGRLSSRHAFRSLLLLRLYQLAVLLGQ